MYVGCLRRHRFVFKYSISDIPRKKRIFVKKKRDVKKI
jgi:hypothetical protein